MRRKPTILVRLTDGEKEIIYSKAKKYSMPVAAFVRMAAINYEVK